MAAVRSTGSPGFAIGAIFFASGFGALVYEILWLRTLRTVVGGGAEAAAATLALFFGGLALGSFFFGPHASRSERPLRGYARLEFAIALTAGISYLLPAIIGNSSPGILATIVPVAFLLGGTMPFMAEVVARGRPGVPAAVARVYALNTAGSALGAFVAGLWLPALLGLRASYTLAIGINLGLAAAASLLDRSRTPGRGEAPAARPDPSPSLPLYLAGLAFLAGAATLGLEVAWTRMLALVLNSSVHAFGALLSVLLAALAIGAALSGRLSSRLPIDLHLFVVLLASSITVAASPFVLHAITGRLGSIPGDWGFGPYLLLVVLTTGVTIGPPAAACGSLLPALLRLDPQSGPGRRFGRLAGWNTAGGVLGSLSTGFFLLPHFGLWTILWAGSFLYLGLGVLVLRGRRSGVWPLRAAALVAAIGLATSLDPRSLLLVRAPSYETILEVWQTPHGLVAVTEDEGGRKIRLDNVYVLGGTEGRDEERLQTELPLALHPGARSAFFLGLGTGITAARALEAPTEHVRAVELIPEVITASRKFFAEDAGPLFRDPRARVLAGDGRHELARSGRTWDLIVSDLFTPWHEGTGNLYTREHFRQVRRSLAPGGVFVQWLPLFQLDRDGFAVIARTLLEVFDDIDLWYADFGGDRPIAALVARPEGPVESIATPSDPLPVEGIATPRDPLPVEAIRVGALGPARDLFSAAPINTDDHPILEHRAPRALAAVRSGQSSWMVGDELDRLVAEIQARAP
jgi:spermidine synthase